MSLMLLNGLTKGGMSIQPNTDMYNNKDGFQKTLH